VFDGRKIFQGKPVLVLGAGGFIGRWAARLLHAQGARLHLAVRDVAAAERLFGRYKFTGTLHEVDLSQNGAVSQLVERVQPSMAFNLAGYGVDRSERDESLAEIINTRLPEELALALADQQDAGALPISDTILIHVGSALEYGEIAGDLAEESVPRATTLYGRTKLQGTLALQRVCRERGLPGVTARLFTVFGPGEHPGRLLPSLLESASGNETIALSAGNQRRDFCYVEDVAEGLLRLAGCRCEPGEIINLATGELASVRRFVEVAAEALGIDYTRLDFGAVATRSEEMSHDPVRIVRLKERTDWSPSSDLKDGIRRACAVSLG
jgi:UDP-glucose 4-epimerase